ncbi:hypothetical protein BOX15_Mlig001899g4, partial [Macrostomum lignano]
RMQTKDIEDLQCLSLGRIDLNLGAGRSYPNDVVARPTATSLVACTSQGLVIAARAADFVVTNTADIETATLTTHKTSTQLIDKFAFRCTVPTTKGRPTGLAVNSDSSLLAVATEGPSGAFVSLYELAWFSASAPAPAPYLEIRASQRANIYVSQIGWNPELSDSLFCLLSDGSLSLYSLASGEGVTIVGSLTNRPISAACWSPRGKQLVACFCSSPGQQQRFVHLEQFDLNLACKRKIDATQAVGNALSAGVTNLLWLSTFRFFLAGTSDGQSGSAGCLACPKEPGRPVYTDLGEIGMSFAPPGCRQIFYQLAYVPQWSLLIAALSTSVEASLLQLLGNEPSVSELLPPYGKRITLPAGSNGTDSFCLGLAYSSVPAAPVPVASDETVTPRLHVYSVTNTGYLCPFAIVPPATADKNIWQQLNRTPTEFKPTVRAPKPAAQKQQQPQQPVLEPTKLATPPPLTAVQPQKPPSTTKPLTPSSVAPAQPSPQAQPQSVTVLQPARTSKASPLTQQPKPQQQQQQQQQQRPTPPPAQPAPTPADYDAEISSMIVALHKDIASAKDANAEVLSKRAAFDSPDASKAFIKRIEAALQHSPGLSETLAEMSAEARAIKAAVFDNTASQQYANALLNMQQDAKSRRLVLAAGGLAGMDPALRKRIGTVKSTLHRLETVTAGLHEALDARLATASRKQQHQQHQRRVPPLHSVYQTIRTNYRIIQQQEEAMDQLMNRFAALRVDAARQATAGNDLSAASSSSNASGVLGTASAANLLNELEREFEQASLTSVTSPLALGQRSNRRSLTTSAASPTKLPPAPEVTPKGKKSSSVSKSTASGSPNSDALVESIVRQVMSSTAAAASASARRQQLQQQQQNKPNSPKSTASSASPSGSLLTGLLSQQPAAVPTSQSSVGSTSGPFKVPVASSVSGTPTAGNFAAPGAVSAAAKPSSLGALLSAPAATTAVPSAFTSVSKVPTSTSTTSGLLSMPPTTTKAPGTGGLLSTPVTASTGAVVSKPTAAAAPVTAGLLSTPVTASTGAIVSKPTAAAAPVTAGLLSTPVTASTGAVVSKPTAAAAPVTGGLLSTPVTTSTGAVVSKAAAAPGTGLFAAPAVSTGAAKTDAISPAATTGASKSPVGAVGLLSTSTVTSAVTPAAGIVSSSTTSATHA